MYDGHWKEWDELYDPEEPVKAASDEAMGEYQGTALKPAGQKVPSELLPGPEQIEVPENLIVYWHFGKLDLLTCS